MYGPFFYAEATVTGVSCLDVLQQWLFPQLHEAEPENFIWQRDGAQPHWHAIARDWLNNVVPDTWIDRKGPDDKSLFLMASTFTRSDVMRFLHLGVCKGSIVYGSATS